MQQQRRYYESIREYLVSPDQRRGIVAFERLAAQSSSAADHIETTGAPPAVPVSATDALMRRLQTFFKDKGNFDRLKMYLERGRESPVSLRILDFLCTENGIALKGDAELPSRYQHMLKTYSKGLFDMFARGDKTTIEVNGEKLQTTIGQLNFFRWSIETGLLNRVQDESSELRDGVRKRGSDAPHPVTLKKQRMIEARIKVGGRFDPGIALPLAL